MKIFTKIAVIAVVAFALVAGASSADAAFTRYLTIGSTGADVTELQTILESQGYLVMPAGVAKGYFGQLTKNAVMKWQAAVGLPATGYFGPMSIAKISAVVMPPVDNDDDMDSDDDNDMSGGETSLEDFDASTGDDTDVEENDTADVAEFEFDVEDADAEIDRVDVSFQAASSEEDPWDTFEEVTLVINGEEIDTLDASDEDEWSDEESEIDTAGDDYSLRFTGVDTVIDEGDTANIVVRVTVQNGVDDLPATWEVAIGDEGIRATDSEGIDSYIGDGSDSVSFDIEEAGQDEELTVREGEDNPDGTTLQLEDDTVSDWYTVLAFEIEAEESDIEVNELPVTFTLSSTTLDIDDIIDDAELVIDGETYDDYDSFSSTADVATTTFDLDGDLVIDADTTVQGELRVRFTSPANDYVEGTTVTSSLTSDNVNSIDAEGEEDLDADGLSGSAVRDAMTLRTAGVAVEMAEDATAAIATNDADSAADDEGVYTFEINVTAFEDGQYVKLDAAEGTTTSPTTGFNYVVETSSSTRVTTGAFGATVELIEGGDERNGYAFIEDGETATFRVIVNYNPAHTAGTGISYRARVDSVNFNDTEAAPDGQIVLVPKQDFRSAYKQVQN